MPNIRILVFLLISLVLHAQKAPKISGLSIDDRQGTTTSSNARTSALGDPLSLPFFDDFTGYDRKFDSIVIKNGVPVRLYSPLLDVLGTDDTILISFPDTITNSLKFVYPIFGTIFIQQESPGIYLMDTVNAGFTTALQFTSDTVMYNAYWMRKDALYEGLDSYLWQSSDALINNRFGKQPPSFNVATFDGLKADGTPYNSTNTSSVGQTDVLTSNVIDLSKYKIVDSLYISFYFQARGFGEVPDATDYLELQLLDSNNVWVPVWHKVDTGSAVPHDTFGIANIAITDTIFFHDGFKFRFRAVGRQAGMYDVWNIDYIYLNKSRSNVYKRGNDWAIGEMESTFLKNFTAIPYRHFYPHKGPQSDSIKFLIMNLLSYKQSALEVYGSASDNLGNVLDNHTFIDEYIQDGSYVEPNGFAPDTTQFPSQLDPRYIKHSVRLSVKDSVYTFWHNNNRAQTNTTLYNYYAYDDNSAEAGMGFEYIGAKIGNQYIFLEDDTITDVDFKFVRGRGPNMQGRTIILKIWNSAFNEIFSKPISVSYAGTARYSVGTIPVDAGAAYYIGYQQNFLDLLTVGFDKNTEHQDKIYYESGNTFVPYTDLADADAGALMIRPVFVKAGEELVGTKDPVNAQRISVYPMPVSGILNIEGKLEAIQIFNMLGAEVFSSKFNPGDTHHEIDLSGLPTGVYVLRSGNAALRIVKQ